MDQYQKKIKKHPTECDQTLEVVLNDIIFRNENDDDLVRYDFEGDYVVLTYEG